MNTIILLHGALGCQTQLEALERALQNQGRSTLRIDFSGHHGKPYSSNGFGIEVFSEDVLHALNNKQLRQVDVFGYSMGGYVALWLAHQQPDRIGRIVTLGTKFDWNPESAEKEIRKMNADKIEEKVPAFARLLQQRHAPNDWKDLVRKTADMMLGLGQKPLLTKEVFKSINNEVTILLGDQDDMTDRDFSMLVSIFLPNGKFELLPQTPHPIEKVNLANMTKNF